MKLLNYLSHLDSFILIVQDPLNSEDIQFYKALSCSGQRSITYADTKTWNELRQYIKEAQPLDVFKDRLKTMFV